MDDTFYTIRGKGPLLLTSPHTVKSLREGTVHLNERRIYTIMTKLYDQLGSDHCTLMTWNVEYFRTHKITPDDANFLETLDSSPWFHRLQDLVNGSDTTPPYVHFDIHGMRDDSTMHDIEFGMSALKLRRPLSYITLRHLTEAYFSELDISLGFESPFQGWKANQYTVTEQGVLLGNYSIQIELSHSIRIRLSEDQDLLKRFASALKNITQRFRFTPSISDSTIPRRRVGILSIPIYSKLRRRIPKGNSYISDDYLDFVKHKLDADPIPLPFDLDKKELDERLRGVHAIVLPGGSYGNITDTEGYNTELLRKFIDSFFHILETMKRLNDQGIFMPIYGICLGFQLLCLSSHMGREKIIDDVRLKESGLIMRRLSSLQICPCDLTERFEQVLRVPLDLRDGTDTNYNKKIHYFLFTNHRIIPYTEATLDQFRDIDVMSVYRNKAGLRVMSSIRHQRYPFIGFQFHPEKVLHVEAAYMREFYTELRNLIHLPLVYDVKTLETKKETEGSLDTTHAEDQVSHVETSLRDLQHAGTYTNRKKITYYIY